MDIEYKNKDDDKVAFGDIKVGEIFESDEKLYLKILSFGNDDLNAIGLNAFNLNTNSIHLFFSNTLVKPLKGKLIIENYICKGE